MTPCVSQSVSNSNFSPKMSVDSESTNYFYLKTTIYLT